MNRADNRKALIQLTGATRVVGEAFQLSPALHRAYRQHRRVLAHAESERPPRGGLSNIRSGVDQAAVRFDFLYR
jgi:hypothetical protein